MKNLRNTPVFNFIASFLVLVLSTILPLFFSGASAFAEDYGDDSHTYWISSASYRLVRAGETQQRTYSFSSSLNNWTASLTDTQVDGKNVNITDLFFNTSNPLPENVLFTFTVRYHDEANNGLEYVGLTPDDSWYKVDEQCTRTLTNTNGKTTDLVCVYWGYSPELLDAGSGSQIGAESNTRIAFYSYGSSGTSKYIMLSPVNTITSTSSYEDALSSIATLNQNQYNRLVDILSNLTQIRNNQTALNTEVQNLSSVISSLSTTQTSTLNAINNLRGDVQAQTEQQHEDYENEVQREEDKQDELEDQADDVNISANAISNPFSNLFSSANCASLPTLASWLHVSSNNIQVCSPYPQQFRPIIEFVSSAIVVGLLIRVYYKQLKGGFAS